MSLHYLVKYKYQEVDVPDMLSSKWC